MLSKEIEKSLGVSEDLHSHQANKSELGGYSVEVTVDLILEATGFPSPKPSTAQATRQLHLWRWCGREFWLFLPHCSAHPTSSKC